MLGYPDVAEVDPGAALRRPGPGLDQRGRVASPAARGHRRCACPPPSSSTADARAAWPSPLELARRAPEHRPPSRMAAAGRADRDRRHGLPLPRAAPAHRRSCGGCVADGGDAIGRLPRRPRLGPGRPLRPRSDSPAVLRARAASCTTPPTSTPAFFGISPARGARHGPAAAAAAGDRLGGAGTGRASTRGRCAAAAPASSSAPPARTTAAAAAGRAGGRRGLPADRRRRQRALRPGRLHARAGGPGGDRRHRLLLVAGRAAPGRAGAARAASATWPWPAASP